MLTGELPIGHFELPSRKRPQECDARIDEVVRKSLEKAPEKRYQRASEMGGDVSRLLSVPAGEGGKAPEGGEGRRSGFGLHLRARLGRRGRDGPCMTDEDLAESIRAATSPWALASYIGGFWMMLLMAIFGTSRDERFWILAAASSGVLFFLSAALLFKKRYGALAAWGSAVAAATVGGVLLQDAPWGARAWTFEVVEYRGPMDEDELEAAAARLLKEVDVQLWVKNSVSFADTFPRGVLVRAREVDGACTLEVAIPDSLTSSPSTAQELAAATGIVFATRIEGAKRVFTVGAGRELQLQQLIPQLQKEAGAPLEKEGE
jgi:hypothetical protein